MDVYRTEEEQIAAIKSWWKTNGMGTLVAVLLAIAAFGGWKWYQHAQQEKALAAAGLYANLMQAWQQVAAGDAGAADAEVRMAKIGDELAADYSGTPYARFAALILAGHAVDKDDLAGAEKQLRAVIAKKKNDPLGIIAADRLAHILAAQGRHEDALALLAGEVPKEFVSAREDTRGDVLMAQGKRAEARAAWQKALDTAGQQDPARMLLEMKLAYVSGG